MFAFRSKETWNTLWTLANCEGKFILYTTGLIRLRISNGLMYIGANFPFIPNLNICFHEATFKNTLSLGLNSRGLLRISTYLFLSILSCLHSIFNNPHFFSDNLHQFFPIQPFIPYFFPTQGCPTFSAIKGFKGSHPNCCLMTIVICKFYQW